MNYKHRLIEQRILDAFDYFPIVAVLGARQVGKSTLIQNLFGDRIRTVVFDPVQDIANARKDPDFFLQNNPPPLFLDEIQYAPELLPALKRRVDRDGRNGLYIISGSQNLAVMKNISESLAGRVSLQHLLPMSFLEIDTTITRPSFLHAWIVDQTVPNLSGLRQRKSHESNAPLLARIFRGGYPGLVDFPDHLLSNYWQSYLQTYIERDVRTVAMIGSLQTFGSFFGILAALSAHEINPSHIGRELGVDRKTAQYWVEIASSTYQWITIPAYSRNAIKKAAQKAKGFFVDTGFLCYLQRITSSEALANHPALGRIVETALCMEIIKQCNSWQLPPNYYHFRLHSGAEVDLVLELNGTLFPIEIKAKSHPTPSDCVSFASFRQSFTSERIFTNLLVCAIEEPAFITADTLALPWHWL